MDQKYLGKKTPESSEQQNLNLLCPGNCLHSTYVAITTIYIVLGDTGNLEVISGI